MRLQCHRAEIWLEPGTSRPRPRPTLSGRRRSEYEAGLYNEALYDCQFGTLDALNRGFFFHRLFFPVATVMALLRVMTVLPVELRQ